MRQAVFRHEKAVLRPDAQIVRGSTGNRIPQQRTVFVHSKDLLAFGAQTAADNMTSAVALIVLAGAVTLRGGGSDGKIPAVAHTGGHLGIVGAGEIGCIAEVVVVEGTATGLI